MLSDEVIDRVTERLVNRMEQANEYILQEIGKSIKKIGTLTPSQAQQLVQIMRYGGDFDKIITKLAQITKLNKKDIYKIFQEVAKMEQGYAKQFYKYRGKKFVKYDDNKQLQNMVKAIAKMTADKYVNLSKTYAFATTGKNGKIVYTELSKKYQDVLDKAIISAGQGKESFDSAMRRTLRELAQSGIRSVDYESGRSIRADTALRMHLKEGLRTLHNEMQKQFGKQFDSDGVEISVHANPAPDHALAQGRQFSTSKYDEDGNEIEKGEWEKLQETGRAKDFKGLEIDMHLHRKSGKIATTFRPISTLNCYHFTYAIVLGVSEPNFTDEELQKIIDDNNKGFDFEGKHYTMYAGTQLQRKLETEIRKQKDQQILARASGDMDLVRESQENIRKLTDKYNELSKASGLQTKIERMRVDGYHKIKVPEASDNIPKDVTYNVWDGDTIYLSADRTAIYKDGLKTKIQEVKKEMDEDKKILVERNIPETDSSMNASHYRAQKSLYEKYTKEYNELPDVGEKKITLNTLENCQELLKYNNIKMNTDSMKDLDFDLIKAETKQLYDLANKYPAIRDELSKYGLVYRADYIPANEVAKTSQYEIILNKTYYKDYKKMYNMNYDDVISNFHMFIPKENLDKLVITHEFGHAVSNKMLDLYRVKFKDLLTHEEWDKIMYDRFLNYASEKMHVPKETLIDTQISIYGKSLPAEAFAELFLSANCGGGRDEIGKLFDEWLVNELAKYD